MQSLQRMRWHACIDSYENADSRTVWWSASLKACWHALQCMRTFVYAQSTFGTGDQGFQSHGWVRGQELGAWVTTFPAGSLAHLWPLLGITAGSWLRPASQVLGATVRSLSVVFVTLRMLCCEANRCCLGEGGGRHGAGGRHRAGGLRRGFFPTSTVPATAAIWLPVIRVN